MFKEKYFAKFFVDFDKRCHISLFCSHLNVWSFVRCRHHKVDVSAEMSSKFLFFFFTSSCHTELIKKGGQNQSRIITKIMSLSHAHGWLIREITWSRTVRYSAVRHDRKKYFNNLTFSRRLKKIKWFYNKNKTLK